MLIIEIKDNNFINYIDSIISEDKVICWVEGIGLGCDNDAQKIFIKNSIGIDYNQYVHKLIFGPIFFIKRNTFSKVVDQIKILPNCKNEECGMERGFGALFYSNNIEVISIDGNYNFNLMCVDGLKYLTKHHADRK